VGIKVYENKILSVPIYLAIMTLLSGIIMFNSKYKKSRIFNVILGISLSVVIYYVNYFSGLLGETGQIPVILSVWLPLIILMLISLIGLVRLNEK
jgi:lipopolysaccharide export system permease protein